MGKDNKNQDKSFTNGNRPIRTFLIVLHLCLLHSRVGEEGTGYPGSYPDTMVQRPRVRKLYRSSAHQPGSGLVLERLKYLGSGDPLFTIHGGRLYLLSILIPET